MMTAKRFWTDGVGVRRWGCPELVHGQDAPAAAFSRSEVVRIVRAGRSGRR